MRRTSLGQWIFNLSIVALIGVTLFGAFLLFARAIEKGAVVVGASLAALATVTAALIVRYFERRKDAEAARRERLGALYEEIASAATGQARSQRTIEKTITQFHRKALIFASPAVITAFRKWRDGLPEDDAPREVQRASALRFEALVKAMRKDLGTSNFMLDEGDLLRTVLNDFDDFYGSDEPDLLRPPEPSGEVTVTPAPAKRRS